VQYKRPRPNAGNSTSLSEEGKKRKKKEYGRENLSYVKRKTRMKPYSSPKEGGEDKLVGGEKIRRTQLNPTRGGGRKTKGKPHATAARISTK